MSKQTGEALLLTCIYGDTLILVLLSNMSPTYKKNLAEEFKKSFPQNILVPGRDLTGNETSNETSNPEHIFCLD